MTRGRTSGRGMRVPATVLLVLLIAVPRSADAQIGLSGLMSFDAIRAGEDSAPSRNGVVDPNFHFIPSSLILFAEAPVSDGITFSGAIASLSHGEAALGPAHVLYASVTFWDVVGKALSIEAGKIVSPFGGFVSRQYPDQDPLIGEPLMYGRGVNVSRFAGLSKSSSTIYDSTGTVATLYWKRYISGVRAFGEFMGGDLTYDLCLSSNAPASSIASSTNPNGAPGISARIGYRPFMWLSAGVSLSSGGYLEPSPSNAGLSDLGAYKQQATGVDLTFDYHYLRVSAEMVSNRWDSPYLDAPSTSAPDRFQIKNQALLFEAQWDVASVPGLYVAGRYEQLTFGNIWDDMVNWTGNLVPWDDDVTRIQAGVGWKPARGVLLKLVQSLQQTSGSTDPSDDVTAAQLVVVF